MLKTLEICVFGLSELQKITLELFFGPPRPPSDAPNSATLPFRIGPGRPKGVPGSPRDAQKVRKASPGIPQGLSFKWLIGCELTISFGLLQKFGLNRHETNFLIKAVF